MENADALIAEDEQVSRDFLIEWEKDKIERDKMWEKKMRSEQRGQQRSEKRKNLRTSKKSRSMKIYLVSLMNKYSI